MALLYLGKVFMKILNTELYVFLFRMFAQYYIIFYEMKYVYAWYAYDTNMAVHRFGAVLFNQKVCE